MRKTFWLTTVVAALTLAAPAAQAQSQWFDGRFAFVPGLACVTWNAETAVTAYAGYWGTSNLSFPVVGDVTYVHAGGAVVGNPCSGGDVIGFDFFFPPGTELAVSAQNPVICIGTNLTTGATTTTDPNIHCSQSATIGTYGGSYFGYAVVPHGWNFEVRVPVRFTQPLVGSGATNHKVQAMVSTVEGTAAVEAYVWAPYRAVINYPTPSATFASTPSTGVSRYNLGAYVYNYFTAGTFSLQAAADPGTLADIAGTSVNIPATGNGFTASWTMDVYSGYRYQWRAKFVSTSGTFYGPIQYFTSGTTSSTSYALTVARAGAGAGNVRSDPQGIDCGTTCSASFTAGSPVTLTASPAPGSIFSGWSGGGCSGTATCTVSLGGTTSVTASFGVAPVPTIGSLDIEVNGPAGVTGSLTVTGPGGFSRAFTMAAGTGSSLSDVAPGQYVGVAANASASGSTYVPRPATSAAAVLAGGKGLISTTYKLGRSLAVSRAGTGTGGVTSNPNGVDCGTACTAWFADAETVTLTATPAAGSAFTGWSGACTGAGACTVNMGANAAVTATFAASVATTRSLVVTRAGAGTGTVTSSPAGIDCGATCTASFADGASVSLTASPAGGSTFTGWSGACTGAGACTVTMGANAAVTATFATGVATTGALNITLAGPTGVSASVTVTGPGGLNSTYAMVSGTPRALSGLVTGSYQAAFGPGTLLGATYVARPATATATVTTGGTGVLATTYGLARSVAVTRTGTGAGTVASVPVGIDCGAACSAWFANGETVSLTATPASGSTFTGWMLNGASAGSANPLVFNPTTVTTVAATFDTGGGATPPSGGGGGGGCSTGGSMALLALLGPLMLLLAPRRRPTGPGTRGR